MFNRIIKAIILKSDNIIKFIYEPTYGVYYIPEIKKAVFLESQWNHIDNRVLDGPTEAARMQLRKLIKKEKQ